MKLVRFQSSGKDDFHRALRKEVNSYFKEKGLSKTGNWHLYVKTVVLFSGMILPFLFQFILPSQPTWVYILSWAVMGFSMAGIGLSIMHDAVHGSFSSNRKINDLIGHASMFLIGGFVANWRIQHNQLHHTFTNVEGLDEDISPPFDLLRLSPDYPLQKKHRFQHIYAWFLYLLMTLMWCTTKDFKQLSRFNKSGFYANKKNEYRKEWIRLIGFKIGYFGWILGIPLLLSPYSVLSILLGFLTMHMIAGFILVIVFQPAHVTPNTEFPKEDEAGILHHSRADHQMLTTQNFANSNAWLSWYVGGLNFQIEHHLFPNVCHVHYKAIAPIVKRVALQYELPYLEIKTFRSAVYEHGKMLYKLGQV